MDSPFEGVAYNHPVLSGENLQNEAGLQVGLVKAGKDCPAMENELGVDELFLSGLIDVLIEAFPIQ